MGDHILGILRETWSLWRDMGIYLVFGFAVAGVLSRVLTRDFISRHLGRNSLGSVAKASLFGVPLPLCSCGVIPVGLSLFKRGASRGATTSFLISTPQTGVDSIAVTYAFLGPVFAVVRPLAAFVNGLLGGGAVSYLTRENPLDESVAGAEACGVEDCDDPDPNHKHRVSLGRHVVEALRYGFVEFPREIAGLLVVGIVAAGAIAYMMPDSFLERYLGAGFMPMVIMAVAGIPIYICATASVPIVAVLVVKGLSPGAALVFLMTGPATNAATLVLLSRTLGKRSTITYLVSIVVTSFAAGWMLDGYYSMRGVPLMVDAAQHHHEMWPVWVTTLGTIGITAICLGVFAGKLRDRFAARAAPIADSIPEGSAMTEIKVDGMTCNNCVEHVRKAAESVEGVDSAQVDLKAGVARIAGDEPDLKAVAAAIEAAGYSVARGG